MNEQQLKENLAQMLINSGCNVFLDRGNGFPTFKGKKKLKSLKKPDLIVFLKNGNGYVTNPFGVEVKLGDSYGKHINQVIEQMRNYKTEPSYIIDGETYNLKTLFLTTKPAIFENVIYKGSSSFPFTFKTEAQKAIEWAIVRQLFSLTSATNEKLYFGLLKKDFWGFYLAFPNFIYRIENGNLEKRWTWSE